MLHPERDSLWRAVALARTGLVLGMTLVLLVGSDQASDDRALALLYVLQAYTHILCHSSFTEQRP